MSAYEDATRAYMAGHKTEAQTLLGKALRANPRDQASWLLLAQCVDVTERKKYCLQQVLLINPKNPEALQRLAELEKLPTPAFKANTVSTEAPSAPTPEPARAEPTPEEAPTTPAPAAERTAAPVEPPKPITRPLVVSESTDETFSKPSTRPLPAIPSEPAFDEASAEPAFEPKKPITRPLAPPPEEPKKPATQPLPPPPPALQEILNARAQAATQAGSTDDTFIGSSAIRPNDQPAFDAFDEDFAPLPDSVPAVSSIESSLMDDNSFKPSPFADPDELNDGIASNPAFSDEDIAALTEESAFTEPENIVSSTDATLVGLSAPTLAMEPVEVPAAPPTPPAPTIDKAALRTRLELGVKQLEQGDKLEGVRTLEALLKDDPRNEMAWMWLGAASYDVNRQRECYLRALEINPKNKMARQRLDEAEDKLTAAGIALQPLAEPLPPAQPDEAPKGSSGVNIWVVIVLVLFVLMIFTGIVFLLLSRR